MTKPIGAVEFKTRETVIFILAMITATALTIGITYLLLEAFVLHDPKDPLAKAGGLSPLQERKLRAKGK
jgi:hypothetical protein